MEFKVGDLITFKEYAGGRPCDIYGKIQNITPGRYNCTWYNKTTNEVHIEHGGIQANIALPYGNNIVRTFLNDLFID